MDVALATSVALILGFVVFVFLLRRSGGAEDEPPKPLPVKCTAIRTWTTTGRRRPSCSSARRLAPTPSEGFAKAFAEEGKARYEEAAFKVVDFVSLPVQCSYNIRVF
ncbi:NADPH--cytochrome P450 reductase-like [Zingiber officinale]|uniref:NADPH--cytochrome P450 reductase-like n=1 Tax=Zingiber officinale TaxID=94328 RepID=UPI001C4B34FC|nr:NADPH--cytochrome P450 reductase-like [Zingiber officinale]